MHSIKSKITLITVSAIVITMLLAMILGINAVVRIGQERSGQILELLCETGEKNLDFYFEDFERSVGMVSSYAEADLETRDVSDMERHVEHVRPFFERIAEQTSGVLTFYYRIDPEYSKDSKGFWYVYVDGKGFVEHETTDITEFDTSDASRLVWFTVPKNEGEAVWLPPYVTENLNARVLSYNVPVYKDGVFVGVIGIELDYTTMTKQVNSIRFYKNGYAFITDAEGNIIYHPHIDVLSMNPEDVPKVPEGLLGGEEGTILRYDFEGVKREAICMDLINGMRLNVSVPVHEINGDWEKLIIRMVVTEVLILIVFILLAMLIAGKITKPIVELTKAAKQVNDGNYDVVLRPHGKDEISILTLSFSQLVAHLKAYISNLHELNEHLKEDNLTLEAATIRDPLTGVKNRFALRRDYEKYFEQDIHIMMLDLDEFKSINDSYGHNVGDYLLKKTGDALLDQFGAEHSYRYGGDEFLVIYPDISEEEFRASTKKLGEQLEEVYLDDRKLPVRFSAGYVYGKTVTQDDLRLMLRQADDILYQAKGSGKNTFIGEKYERSYAEKIMKKEEEAFRQG